MSKSDNLIFKQLFLALSLPRRIKISQFIEQTHWQPVLNSGNVKTVCKKWQNKSEEIFPRIDIFKAFFFF